MPSTVWYVFGSVFAVSVAALVGIVLLLLDADVLERGLLYLVSFAAGTLFGTAFLHLLPHTAEEHGIGIGTGMYLLGGVVLAFLLETYLYWHHHTLAATEVEPFSYLILFGDGLHNLVDGMVIAASYLAGVSTGIATTVAVLLHELPQELGDFAIMVHGGFRVRTALLYNVAAAATAFIGAGAVLAVAGSVDAVTRILLPFAAGTFIYIAGSDLVPEMQEQPVGWKAAAQMLLFLLGIGVMYLLAVVGV